MLIYGIDEVSAEQRDSFQREGYCILEGVIMARDLAMLREECAYFIGYTDGATEARGEAARGTHRGSRYFIANRYRSSPHLHRFLFGPLMAEITRALLGPQVYLFNEQWVVKGAEQGMEFAWHQDSGYVLNKDPGALHPPYLTCWCALDDVHEGNGTVFVLPHSVADTRERILPHERQEKTNDLIGYSGDESGIPVNAPAGTIGCFTSYNLHRSSANTSSDPRRAYLAQYTSAPLIRGDKELWAMAVPFLSEGASVYDRAEDVAERYGVRPR